MEVVLHWSRTRSNSRTIFDKVLIIISELQIGELGRDVLDICSIRAIYFSLNGHKETLFKLHEARSFLREAKSEESLKENDPEIL